MRRLPPALRTPRYPPSPAGSARIAPGSLAAPVAAPNCGRSIVISDRRKSLFLAKVISGPVEACWPWGGSISRGGYGNFRDDLGVIKAHRVAFFLHHGIDPAGKVVCHSCDNPVCCNPHHLWLGTHRDNFMDALEKGRVAPFLGGADGFGAAYEKCPNGHAYSPDNTRVRPGGLKAGTRFCVICRRESQRRYQARRKAAENQKLTTREDR